MGNSNQVEQIEVSNLAISFSSQIDGQRWCHISKDFFFLFFFFWKIKAFSFPRQNVHSRRHHHKLIWLKTHFRNFRWEKKHCSRRTADRLRFRVFSSPQMNAFARIMLCFHFSHLLLRFGTKNILFDRTRQHSFLLLLWMEIWLRGNNIGRQIAAAGKPFPLHFCHTKKLNCRENRRDRTIGQSVIGWQAVALIGTDSYSRCRQSNYFYAL